MTTKEDSMTNHRIITKLVEREVTCNVNRLVSHFAHHPDALDGSGYYYEDILDLCRCPADPKDVLEEHGYSLQEAENEWHIVIDSELEEFQWVAEQLAKPHPEESDEELMEKLMTYSHGIVCDEDSHQEALDHLRIEIEDHDSEVYEHWVVSEHLAERLKENGQTVGELFGLTIWGRTTTGQSMVIDWIMNKIASDMEILEGQKYSWAESVQ